MLAHLLKYHITGGNSVGGIMASCYSKLGFNWTPKASMNTARMSAAAVLFDSKTIWISGGVDENDVLATTEVYIESNFTTGPSLPFGVY